jgi:hypothetical protein
MALNIINEGIGAGRNVSQIVCEMQDKIGIAHWTTHDLRRTALTKMAELGVAPI